MLYSLIWNDGVFFSYLGFFSLSIFYCYCCIILLCCHTRAGRSSEICFSFDITEEKKTVSISFPLPISLDLSRAGLYSRVMSYDWRRNVVYARVVNDSQVLTSDLDRSGPSQYMNVINQLCAVQTSPCSLPCGYCTTGTRTSTCHPDILPWPPLRGHEPGTADGTTLSPMVVRGSLL